MLIVDGGKGQLSRAVAVLERFGLSDRVPVAGLAKQEEEIFLPGRKDSVRLKRRSQGLFMIQRIRDEAHRFAITAHRGRRTRQGLASTLDSIPGIGPQRRKLLLQRFGSLDGIREASVDEVAALQGFSEKLAHSVKAHLE